MRTLIALFLILISFSACEAQKENLVFNLEKGKTYKQDVSMTTVISQTVQGFDMNIEMVIDASSSYLVKDINNGTFDLEVKYEKMVMEMKMPMMNMKFSSEDNDPENMFSTMLGKMVDYPFSVKMDKSGKVSEIKGIEEMFDGIISAFPGVNPEEIGQVKEQIMQAFGEKAFTGNFESFTAIYPGKEVKVGDTWVVNTKLESAMAADMATTFKLKKSDSNFWYITGESTVKTADQEAYVEAGGMPVKYDLSGTATSDLKIDKKTGWVIEGTMDQNIEGSAEIGANPMSPEPMKVPMKFNNKMKLKGN